MISYNVIAVSAVFAGTLQRYLVIFIYRNWFNQGFAGDAALHFMIIKQLKLGSYRGIPQFLIKDEADSYPILFHRFAALFPLWLVQRFSYIPNFILWITFVLISSLYAHYIGTSLSQPEMPLFGLVFLTLVLTLASTIALDMNGLNYIQLSERLLARFSCGLYFGALVTWMRFGDEISLTLAIGSGTAALISSQFGRQAVVFTTPFFSLTALDPRPFIVLVGALSGALLIDGPYFVRGVRHMVESARVYNRYTKHSRYYYSGLSRYIAWRALVRRGAPMGQRLTEMESTEPTRILFRYPELVLLTALWIWRGTGVTDPLVALTVATLVIYLAISTSLLRQFGEANRYIEYNLLLAVPFALADLILKGSIPPAALLAYAVWVLFVTIRNYRRWWGLRYPLSDALGSFVSTLRLRRDDTVFAVPFTLGAAICTRAPCRAIVWQGCEFTRAQYTKFFEEIPYLKRDWRSLAAEYQLTHIIAEKAHLSIMKDLVGWDYDFAGLGKAGETERYIAYTVPADVRSRDERAL